MTMQMQLQRQRGDGSGSRTARRARQITPTTRRRHPACRRSARRCVAEWLNHDPIGELGGVNLFGYVRNDPVNYIDPQGKNIFVAIAIVGCGAVLGTAYFYWNSSKSQAEAINQKAATAAMKQDPSGYGTLGQGKTIQDWQNGVVETAETASTFTSAAGGPFGVEEDALESGGKLALDAISNWDELTEKGISAWNWVRNKWQDNEPASKVVRRWTRCDGAVAWQANSPGPEWTESPW